MRIFLKQWERSLEARELGLTEAEFNAWQAADLSDISPAERDIVISAVFDAAPDLAASCADTTIAPVSQSWNANRSARNVKNGKLDLQGDFNLLKHVLRRDWRKDLYRLALSLMQTGLQPGAQFDIKQVQSQMPFSKNVLYLLLEHPIFERRRAAHNRYVYTMPSDETILSTLRYRLSRRRRKSCEPLTIDDLQNDATLETAYLQRCIARQPGKHHLQSMAANIGRSVSTARRRVRDIVGIIITPNFTEIPVATRDEARQLYFQLEDLGRHCFQFVKEGQSILRRVSILAFDEMTAQGWYCLLTTQTANSCHLAGMLDNET